MAGGGTITTYFAGENASFLQAIEENKGGLRRLLSSLSPVDAATAKFNAGQQALDTSLKRGRITLDQHAEATKRLSASYQAQVSRLQQVTAVSGSTRAGMQQLSYQIGDISQQFALGTKPMVIFAQQGGQVLQAIQLMTNSSKGFIGFLAGPWGVGIMAAAMVLTPFIAKLFEAGEASDAAKDASEALADKIDDLGTFFDKATGKIKQTSSALIEYAKLQAAVRIEEQTQLQSEATKTAFSAFERSRQRTQDPSTVTSGIYLPGSMGPSALPRSRPGSQEIAQAFQSRNVDANLRAIAEAGGRNAEYARTILEQRATFSEAQQSINQDRQFIADLERGFTTNRDFVTGGGRKTRNGAADRTEQRLQKYADELTGLQARQVDLQMDLTGNMRERAALEAQRLDQEAAAYRDGVAYRVKQGELTQAQADQLVLVNDQNTEIAKQVAQQKYDRASLQDENELQRGILERRSILLQGELGLARTQEERRRLQLALLDAGQEELRLSLQRVMIANDQTSAEYQNAQNRLRQLDAERAFAAESIRRGTMGPLESYIDGLTLDADQLNEAFGAVAADGLQSLNDGIVDAITGAKSLGDAFSNVADGIIDDLMRIAVQKYITAPLANTLFGSGSGGFLGGIFGGGSGGGSGVGGGLSAVGGLLGGLPGFADGGSIRVGGLPGTDRNMLSINGVPRAMVSDTETLHVTPANDRGPSGAAVVRLVVGKGEMFDAEVVRISGNVATQKVQSASRQSVLAQDRILPS